MRVCGFCCKLLVGGCLVGVFAVGVVFWVGFGYDFVVAEYLEVGLAVCFARFACVWFDG